MFRIESCDKSGRWTYSKPSLKKVPLRLPLFSMDICHKRYLFGYYFLIGRQCLNLSFRNKLHEHHKVIPIYTWLFISYILLFGNLPISGIEWTWCIFWSSGLTPPIHACPISVAPMMNIFQYNFFISSCWNPLKYWSILCRWNWCCYWCCTIKEKL